MGLGRSQSGVAFRGGAGLITACAVVLVSGWLLYRALPAAGAYASYYRVKYGALSSSEPTARIASLTRVYRSIPRQYHVSALASDICWDAYLASTGEVSAAWAVQSEAWCDRGLATGCALPALVSRKACLLARKDMRGAARYWADYVDQVYWHPANQALLCEFYAAAGLLEEAAERLSLLEGRPEHALASKLFHEAVRAQMRRP